MRGHLLRPGPWVVGIAVMTTVAMLAGCAGQQPVELGFWFEPVTYESRRLSGPLTAQESQAIAAVARSEIANAFAGLRITLTERQDARYRVRVQQDLWDPRFRSQVAVAGTSTALSRFGGAGAVNFSLLASYAVSFAPEEADRAIIVEAIGRGVGRAAVHEFAHQLLGSARIHDGSDRQTYEFHSASRREQYYGELRWGAAWPELSRRFGQGSSIR